MGMRSVFGLAGVLVGLAVARRTMRTRSAHDLAGSCVLVTGASRGLGLALAEEFARRGARLALTARDAESLEHARQQVAAHGTEAIAVPCDVTDPGAVSDLVSTVTERLGRIDVLVNNAGDLVVGPFETRTPEDFRAAMDVMFWGTFHTTFAVLPQMKRRHDGVIANITSIGGKVAAPHLLPYSSAKFAAVGFSEGLHAELAPDGISVVTVVPGFMRTGSYLNARFRGRPREQFTWFSVIGNLPVISTSAGNAARQVVDAVETREAEVMITPLTHVAARVNGLMPGVTARVNGVIKRLLPSVSPGEDSDEARGRHSETAVSESFVTSLGRRAARRLQQDGS